MPSSLNSGAKKREQSGEAEIRQKERGDDDGNFQRPTGGQPAFGDVMGSRSSKACPATSTASQSQ